MLKQERRSRIAVLTLDYPARRNALAMPMREALIEALEAIESDPGLRAIVLTGAGGTFSAGGDISAMDVADFAAGRERFRVTHRLVRLLVEGSKPVIAAVEGWAAGAGLGLALCCDTIVAGASARFMAGFGRVGLIADFGLLHTLPRRIGTGRARQMLLYADPQADAIGADAAERIGLIDHVVPDGTALAAAMERAARFEHSAALPVAMTKSFLAQGLAEALEWERTVQSTLFLTPDHAEGKAAFLEQRPPRFGER